jgi:hypothetical protein
MEFITYKLHLEENNIKKKLREETTNCFCPPRLLDQMSPKGEKNTTSEDEVNDWWSRERRLREERENNKNECIEVSCDFVCVCITIFHQLARITLHVKNCDSLL